MTIERPDVFPEWASEDHQDPIKPVPNVVEPPLSKKQQGWFYAEKPPANWLNWISRFCYRWIRYLFVLNMSGDADTGTSPNTYKIEPEPTIENYLNGMKVNLIPANTNTGASSLEINSLGTKAIVDAYGNLLTAGMVQKNQNHELIYNGTAFILMNRFAYEPSIFDGFTLSNNIANPNTRIDVTGGICTDSTKKFKIVNPNTVFTKDISQVWAAGSGNGGRAGSLTANTWYHFFVISKQDGTVDFGFDTSITASNLLALATGFIYYYRITSRKTDPSSNLYKIFTIDKRHFFDSSIQIANPITLSSTMTAYDAKTPPDVIVRTYVNYDLICGGNTTSLWYRPLGYTDTSAAIIISYLEPSESVGDTFDLYVNNSIIYLKSTPAAGIIGGTINNFGWEEIR